MRTSSCGAFIACTADRLDDRSRYSTGYAEHGMQLPSRCHVSSVFCALGMLEAAVLECMLPFPFIILAGTSIIMLQVVPAIQPTLSSACATVDNAAPCKRKDGYCPPIVSADVWQNPIHLSTAIKVRQFRTLVCSMHTCMLLVFGRLTRTTYHSTPTTPVLLSAVCTSC